MEIKEALEYALILKGAIVRGNYWELCWNSCRIYKRGAVLEKPSDFSKQFMLLLLNTFLEVHKSLTKSPNEEESSAAEKIRKMLTANAKKDEKLQDAHDKYEIPFVRTLQKLAKEHDHNFVQQWLDQHENDENMHLIDFGPANKTKKRTVKIDPAGETPVDDDLEESEEDIPQIVINIGELNINLNV